jgi:hypothetical protein
MIARGASVTQADICHDEDTSMIEAEAPNAHTVDYQLKPLEDVDFCLTKDDETPRRAPVAQSVLHQDEEALSEDPGEDSQGLKLEETIRTAKLATQKVALINIVSTNKELNRMIDDAIEETKHYSASAQPMESCETSVKYTPPSTDDVEKEEAGILLHNENDCAR